MPRDYRQEAEHEDVQRKLRHVWIQQRIEAIHARVTAHDLLRRFGVKLQHSGDNRMEQFCCPFHGKDNKPSARVFPPAPNSPSHCWCFVCQERWDVIALWRKFNDATVPFTQSLAEIERDYGLKAPEMPNMGALRESARDQETEAIQDLLAACERRLRGAKADFDMRGYLTVGSVLDRLHSRVAKGTIPPATARATIRKVLDKIGEKCRAASQ
jgi:hypothetical protein